MAGGGEESILHHQDHNDLYDYDPTKSHGALSTNNVTYQLPTFEDDKSGGQRSLKTRTYRQKDVETATDDSLSGRLCEDDDKYKKSVQMLRCQRHLESVKRMTRLKK